MAVSAIGVPFWRQGGGGGVPFRKFLSIWGIKGVPLFWGGNADVSAEFRIPGPFQEIPFYLGYKSGAPFFWGGGGEIPIFVPSSASQIRILIWPWRTTSRTPNPQPTLSSYFV